MAAPAHIIPLTRRNADLHRFLAVADFIYRDDPNWVAPLRFDICALLSDRNPFFEHAEMQLWVARRDGRDVGRIAAIRDQHYIDFQEDNAAFFGFFECVDDASASQPLFDTAMAWARKRNADKIIGPMNPSTNDECGLLTQGFDSPPVIMMSYNPPFYPRLVEAAGFRKAKDLFAYLIEVERAPAERLRRVENAFRRRQPQLHVRPVTRATLAADIARAKEIYNAAWARNWGFVPMTDAEINLLAARLKPVLRDGLIWIAENGSEPVGFLVLVPDFNEAIQPLRGRVFTPQVFRVLPYLLGRRQPRIVRLLVLGTKPGFRTRGVEAALFAGALEHVQRMGFRACEASWILEDNLPVQRLIALFGGHIYKRYRVYERELG